MNSNFNINNNNFKKPLADHNDVGILNNGNIPRIRSTPQLPAYKPTPQTHKKVPVKPMYKQELQKPTLQKPTQQKPDLEKQQRYNELQEKLNDHRNKINEIVDAYQRPFHVAPRLDKPSTQYPIHRIMALKYDPTTYRTKVHEYDEFHRPDDIIEWQIPPFVLTVDMQQFINDNDYAPSEIFEKPHAEPPMSAPTDNRHHYHHAMMHADLALVKKRVKKLQPLHNLEKEQERERAHSAEPSRLWEAAPMNDNDPMPAHPPRIIRQFSTTYELVYPTPTFDNPFPTPFRRLTSAAISGYAELNYPYSANRAYRLLREKWQEFADQHPEYFDGFQVPSDQC